MKKLLGACALALACSTNAFAATSPCTDLSAALDQIKAEVITRAAEPQIDSAFLSQTELDLNALQKQMNAVDTGDETCLVLSGQIAEGQQAIADLSKRSSTAL